MVKNHEICATSRKKRDPQHSNNVSFNQYTKAQAPVIPKNLRTIQNKSLASATDYTISTAVNDVSRLSPGSPSRTTGPSY